MTIQHKGVSPSIHEELIARHVKIDPTTRQPVYDPILDVMQQAVQGTRAALEKAKRIADAIMKNEMVTLPARHKRIKEESWRVVEGSLKSMDGSRSRALQELEQIKKLITSPPRPSDMAGLSLATEIRGRLANLKLADRKAVLDAAVAEGDDVLVGAVLNGPPMLSGMKSKEEHEMLRLRWQRYRHSDEVDRAERLTAAVADLDRAGDLAVVFISKLSNGDLIAKAEATENAVKAAMQS